MKIAEFSLQSTVNLLSRFFFVENGKRRDFYIVDCLVSMAFRISWESYNYNKFYFISLQLNLFSQTTIHDSVEYHHFC